jgi:FkbM family methyltransferase
MGRRIYKRGSLHPEHTNFLSSLPFEDNDVILDIGGNIGWYSIVLRSSIKQNVTVYSFEPEPQNFQLLTRNVQFNKIKGVQPVNMAVAEHAGHSTLFLYFSKNSGRHSLLNVNPQTNRSIQVETVNLEDFLTNNQIDFSRVKLIKIDIEGYELFALKGVPRLLSTVQYMFLEFSPGLIMKAGRKPSELIHLLAGFDFNFYGIENTAVIPRTINQLLALDHTEDLFLVKKALDTFSG